MYQQERTVMELLALLMQQRYMSAQLPC